MNPAIRQRWLTIIGVGEDGLAGLSPAAASLLKQARFVIGGARHLQMLKPAIAAEAMEWPSPFERGIDAIKARRGAPTCVLASGDPYLYGVGATLAAHIPPDETICLPAPSSLSLAAARLGWPLQDCEIVSLHGRPLERLIPALRPRARLLVLSWDETTPEKVARLLAARGLGDARLVVMAALGGPRDTIAECRARDFASQISDPLNLVAIEIGDTAANHIPLTPGLPDEWYESDGQITKREIRAITLSALAPWPGACLWDVGAGSGSIAIEWMLAHPRNRAVAIEKRADRAQRISRNAAALGAPNLAVLAGDARDLMRDLPAPDAIFVGGGGAATIDAAWSHLPAGRRFVVNAVTIETQSALAERQARHGGDLVQIAVAHPAPLGSYHAWRPAAPIVQWTAVKP
ncbi:MAG TPA: precorrin-6y C5,15-methyltransferase (decarboxylating) subunit CbiE [Roseiarcus sp.]|nr:precorrin-6y C5,15-methyltransferase (decarboxylating) subunit CbiE [Roseiarcus sp.]